MKDNRGFTIIEVAVSFVLVATISLILLQLVLSLKDVYLTGDVKTTLLNKQGIMTKYIYDDLNNKDLVSIKSCGVSCLKFSYGDGTWKNLVVDPGNNTITYGDYTLQLDNSSSFDTLNVTIDETATHLETGDDSLIKIDIPVVSKLLDDDFGFHIIKTYNRSLITIDTTTDLETTSVTLSGLPKNLVAVHDEDDPNALTGIFLQLYHQEANYNMPGNNDNNKYDNFIKNDGVDSSGKFYSNLTSLEALRIKSDADAIVAQQIADAQNKGSALTDKEITLLKQDYQDGYLSLLLNYNNKSLDSGNFAWWYQTSNFAKKEDLAGFYPIVNIGNGLQYVKNKNYLANIVGYDANMGIISGNIYDLDGNVASSVDLYANVRDYICNYSLSYVTYNGANVKDITLSDGTKLCS